MMKCPGEARTPAVMSAVSPGSGTPDDSSDHDEEENEPVVPGVHPIAPE